MQLNEKLLFHFGPFRCIKCSVENHNTSRCAISYDPQWMLIAKLSAQYLGLAVLLHVVRMQWCRFFKLIAGAKPRTWGAPTWHELYPISSYCRLETGIMWNTRHELCKLYNLAKSSGRHHFLYTYIELNAQALACCNDDTLHFGVDLFYYSWI